jgi:hypothetical protein
MIILRLNYEKMDFEIRRLSAVSIIRGDPRLLCILLTTFLFGLVLAVTPQNRKAD